MTALLAVRRPRSRVRDRRRRRHRRQDASFDIEKGEITALVGESGCGKSATALAILRLIPDPPGRITGGQILFEGRDLLKIGENEMRELRGNRIAMIFQEPMTSLNPVHTHRPASRRAGRAAQAVRRRQPRWTRGRC